MRSCKLTRSPSLNARVALEIGERLLTLNKVYLMEPEQSSFGDTVTFVPASSLIKAAEKRFMNMVSRSEPLAQITHFLARKILATFEGTFSKSSSEGLIRILEPWTRALRF